MHDDDVLGTAARGMFRQSEGRQRPLVDGAVIGDDELSLRQRMGPGVPATAASTRTARVNVSSRAENTSYEHGWDPPLWQTFIGLVVDFQANRATCFMLQASLLDVTTKISLY